MDPGAPDGPAGLGWPRSLCALSPLGGAAVVNTSSPDAHPLNSTAVVAAIRAAGSNGGTNALRGDPRRGDRSECSTLPRYRPGKPAQAIAAARSPDIAPSCADQEPQSC